MKKLPAKNLSPHHLLADVILRFLGKIPSTEEEESQSPAARARRIANAASARAAATAGTLALPPGPMGWLTLLPELTAVWKIQTQMVADLAGAYGKSATLSREQMVYCLFRHGAAMAVRDIVVRVGDRYIIRSLTPQVLQTIAKKIGIHLTQKSVGKAVSRWLPFVGAVGVGAYAYYDTSQVARTAIRLFESDLELAPPDGRDPALPPPLPDMTNVKE